MSAQFLRILIAGALFVHGVGHTLGYFRPARSWLLPGAGPEALRIAGGIVWAVAAAGFVAAALGFWGALGPAAWWRTLAAACAGLSLAGLFVFWGTWPLFNTAGAVLMNLAVLAALLWAHWPPLAMYGR